MPSFRRLLLLGALLGLAGCATFATGQAVTVRPVASPLQSDHQRASGFRVLARSTTLSEAGFLSLWRNAKEPTVLEGFSLSDGEPVRRLAEVPEGTELPHLGKGLVVWLTQSSGPRYRNNTAGGDPEPNSCSASVSRLDLENGTSSVVRSFPSSVQADQAVPSPNEHEAAILAGTCSRAYFNQHLLIENLQTGRTWTIGAKTAPCHSISPPSWNPAGTRLVFAYGPPISAHRRLPRSQLGAGLCTSSGPGEIAIVPAGGAGSFSDATLIKPPHGCSYTDAMFDTKGIAAVAGCEKGSEPGFEGLGDYMGDTYLIQLDSRGRVIRKLPLRRGANPATLAPFDSSVLVSEQQGENTRPWWDWIWAFNGQTLRLIRHSNENITAAGVVPLG
jgi:hypothetical protein